MAASNYKTIILPASVLPPQPWWADLHHTINTSYLNKDYSVFPRTWLRLPSDTAKGAKVLAGELGDNGHMAIVFTEDNHPIACSGVLPFRGENALDEAEMKRAAGFINGEITKTGGPSQDSDSFQDWETCCFCVHPDHRGRGLSRCILDELIAFIKTRGAERLYSNYAVAETGDFWTRLGFEVIPGAGGVLSKGFKIDPEKEGLSADIHLKMGVKKLC